MFMFDHKSIVIGNKTSLQFTGMMTVKMKETIHLCIINYYVFIWKFLFAYLVFDKCVGAVFHVILKIINYGDMIEYIFFRVSLVCVPYRYPSKQSMIMTDWHAAYRLLGLTFYQMSILCKNDRFHWKASCYKFKLLWNYEKCSLDHSLCNSMLNRKFPVTMATGVVSKLRKFTILHCFFFNQNSDFKVLQLLNGLR
jgi:hypothetical protein